MFHVVLNNIVRPTIQNPRIETCENLACLRKLQVNKTRVLWIQFLQNTRLFLECIVLSPGVVDKSELTSAVVIHIPLWENVLFAMCVLSM